MYFCSNVMLDAKYFSPLLESWFQEKSLPTNDKVDITQKHENNSKCKMLSRAIYHEEDKEREQTESAHRSWKLHR